jgi:hypothetical protein
MDIKRCRAGTSRPVPSTKLKAGQAQSKTTHFFSKKDEFSLYEGCVLWGTRVVVPKPGRAAVLAELHKGHPGMVRMKGLGRMYVWWPRFSKDIEETVLGCTECQAAPPPEPLQPWS